MTGQNFALFRTRMSTGSELHTSQSPVRTAGARPVNKLALSLAESSRKWHDKIKLSDPDAASLYEEYLRRKEKARHDKLDIPLSELQSWAHWVKTFREK